jgi:hypothetical protein
VHFEDLIYTDNLILRSAAQRRVSKGGLGRGAGCSCFETGATRPPQHEVDDGSSDVHFEDLIYIDNLTLRSAAQAARLEGWASDEVRVANASRRALRALLSMRQPRPMAENISFRQKRIYLIEW